MLNPLVLSWIFLNSFVLYKLRFFKFLFITSFLLTFTTILHHKDYDNRMQNIREIDEVMCLIYALHSMLICYKSPLCFPCLFFICLFWYGIIRHKPKYKNGWSDIQDLLPHIGMHTVCCIGLYLSLPLKQNT